MMPWKRIEPTVVKKVGWRTIVTKTFIDPSGEERTFDIKDREDAGGVAIVAVTTDKKVLLFRQFRPGPEMVMDELPGGMIDNAGDDPVVVGQKELLEETGFVPGTVLYLGKTSYDAYSNGWRHYCLALDCRVAEAPSYEGIEQFGELIKVQIDELIQTALDGRMTDSGGVLMAYEALKMLQTHDSEAVLAKLRTKL